MAKPKEAIGLDVGSKAVKLVRLRRDDSRVEILNYRIIERKEPGVANTEAYREAVSFIKEVKSPVSIIASIEGHHVFTRVFKLPAVGKSKLARIVGYEAQQQVPFPITDVVWAYQCLRKVSPEEADVVLVAVKNDVVEGFLNSFKQLGISIEEVVAPVVGLYHLAGYGLPEQGQATLILDLGDKTTNIIIVEKENLWFRTIPLGGEVVSQAIGQEFNLGLHEAEMFKKEKGSILLETTPGEDAASKKISSCIVRSISRLTGEITRSIEVYCSSFNSLGIKRIFITGGTSGLRDIDQLLAKKFRVDVKSLDVLKGFDIGPSINKERLTQDAPRLGAALGLALQGLGLGRLWLSLLPKDVVLRRLWKRRKAYIAATGSLAIFLGFSFSGYNMQLINIYKANVQNLKSEKKALSFNKGELGKIQQQLGIVKSKMEIVNKVASARTLWMDMLLALEELIPQNVWLTGIEPVIEEELPPGKDVRQEFEPEYLYKTDYIDLRLHAKTSGKYQQIVAFRDALDKSKYFEEGSTEVVSANPPRDGVRDFVIKARLRTQVNQEGQ